jgi:arginine/ornithine transport system substrate-binding protein
MRLKALVMGALLAAAPLGSALAQGATIRIGIDGTYPPFSTVEKGGRLAGFDVEIAQALCDQMKAKCQLVKMKDWYYLIPSIQKGEYDAVVASMSITPERMEKIAFTDRYYTTPVKIVAKKGSAIDGSLASLEKRRVGVQSGTTHEQFVDARLAGKAQIQRFDTLEAALKELTAGRLDAVMADGLALQKGFLATKEGRDFAFVGPAYTDPAFFGPGIGIGLPKERDELRQKLNTALAEIRANGKYQTIAAKYFPFDIYGQP